MKNKIGKNLIYIISILLGASLGALWLPSFWRLLTIENPFLSHVFVNALIGAIILFVFALILSKHILQLVDKIETSLNTKQPTYLLFGSIGTIVGLVIGVLLSSIFNYIHIPVVSDILPVLMIISLAYLGFRVGTRRPESWRKITQQMQIRPKQELSESELLDRRENDNTYRHKILDTSVIIDGRIYDVLETGFLEGVLVVPIFVVHELQYIADSSDSLKRAKGRRGLDILNKIQKNDKIKVEVYEGDFEDIPEVDSKLVKLAKQLDGFVVTNDYNLNKVCEFQNVKVLNINELANAIKPVVLPGERMTVLIVKDGTERQQGVAYMEDGTMIVVEDGQYYMNEQLEVVITSALQTAAGRMIFAKPAHSQKKIKETH